METKEQQFEAELIALIEKYGVKLVEHTSYDNEENPCGSIYAFEGDGFYLSLASLAE